jgi:hypothetical protein
MITDTSRERSASRSASKSAPRNASLSALRFSGRFKVRRRTSGAGSSINKTSDGASFMSGDLSTSSPRGIDRPFTNVTTVEIELEVDVVVPGSGVAVGTLGPAMTFGFIAGREAAAPAPS